MSYANTHRFSVSGFAFACCLTIAINGSVLLGFNHLAQPHDNVNANTPFVYESDHQTNEEQSASVQAWPVSFIR